MIPFTRPCTCKQSKAPLYDVCKVCGDTGTVDILDRLLRQIEEAGRNPEASITMSSQDAQALANECSAIRSMEWMSKAS